MFWPILIILAHVQGVYSRELFVYLFTLFLFFRWDEVKTTTFSKCTVSSLLVFTMYQFRFMNGQTNSIPTFQFYKRVMPCRARGSCKGCPWYTLAQTRANCETCILTSLIILLLNRTRLKLNRTGFKTPSLEPRPI